jgi:DNA-binding MarR family transcriptional regulator
MFDDQTLYSRAMTDPPSPDPSDLARDELVRLVGRTMADLQDAIAADDQALADHLGIHRTDLRCLDLLFRYGPRPAGRLARELGLTPGSVTALLDRLERAGYLARRPDPGHGRRVLATLTPRIVEIVDELFADRLAEAAAELAGYDDRQLADIQGFLAASLARHRAAAERLRALPPPSPAG